MGNLVPAFPQIDEGNAGTLDLLHFFSNHSPKFHLLKESATLVFDIGKTTKKALVFSSDFHVLEEHTTTLEETKDDDGFGCEDLGLLTQWVTEKFRTLVNGSAHNITHINFSGYGASLVGLDNAGKPVLPFYNYLKKCPPEIKKKFESDHGPISRICSETASPWLGLLNSGLQAYWLKQCKPHHFKRIKTLLHFPQYFPFLLTGKKLNDVTGLGCHTLLWNYRTMDYHEWAVREGISGLFPRVAAPVTFEFNVGNRRIISGSGVHDSSAALMPYLVSMKEPFLLLSTGTWNICFNPFNADPLTSDELEKDCLCYLTFEGKPVKASRIFLGHEYEVQQRALAKHFGLDENAHKTTMFDESIYKSLLSAKSPRKRFYPMAMEGTGPLPQKQTQRTDYTAFLNFPEAQHQLMRDLVSWQRLSIDLVDPQKKVRNIILVGGFSKSALFLEILKRELPDRRVLLSEHPRGSALGAAWLTHEKTAYEGAAKLLGVRAV